jgi:hypothetical protein
MSGGVEYMLSEKDLRTAVGEESAFVKNLLFETRYPKLKPEWRCCHEE